MEVVTYMKLKSRPGHPLCGIAGAGTLAVIGSVFLGVVAPGTASAANVTYTASAKSAGLVINVFGTELTGGSATATVNSSTPQATAEGSGVLTPGLIEDQKAAANGAGQSQTRQKACQQGGSLPASSPAGASLGLACSSASAAVSSAGVPTASATGQVTGLDVNVSGVLNQIISSGGNQLFSGIQQVLGQLNGTPLGTGSTACPATSTGTTTTSTTTSGSSTTSTTAPANPLSSLAATAPVPGSPLNSLLGSLGLSGSPTASSPGPLGNLLQGLCQTLTNVESTAKAANPPSTLVVGLGPASASVTGTASGTAEADAKGATTRIQILPGVGCTASTLSACASDPSAYAAPLIDVTVAPAEAVDRFDGTKWTPSSTAALATVALNIPGDAQTITVAPGQSLDLLSGTPLETVIDLASASTSGGTGTANGATLDLAKGVNGGILLNLGSSTVTAGSTPPAAAPPAAAPPAAAPPAAAPPAVSPTTVHTGAWWSGSLPYILVLAAAGAGLLGLPGVRRSTRALAAVVRTPRR